MRRTPFVGSVIGTPTRPTAPLGRTVLTAVRQRFAVPNAVAGLPAATQSRPPSAPARPVGTMIDAHPSHNRPNGAAQAVMLENSACRKASRDVPGLLRWAPPLVTEQEVAKVSGAEVFGAYVLRGGRRDEAQRHVVHDQLRHGPDERVQPVGRDLP
jgi:hypothetical protein